MINSYLGDPVLRIHLPRDEENPTVFHVKPVTMEKHAEWQARQEYIAKQLVRIMPPDTLDGAADQSKRKTDEDVKTLAQFVTKVENGMMDGKPFDCLLGDKLEQYLRGMLVVQRGDLLRIIMDDVQLQELSFRDEPVPAPAGKTPDD